MTDRVSAFIVILEQDMREDDAAALRQALERFRGVDEVKDYGADFLAESIGETRERNRIATQIVRILYPDR
jgi:hypothetical protein